ncbi:hypothetical protein PanWU01x14_288010 [Parasponia andersonii]|uniref:RNase H type-1 domain-containing protein n=1 Tax=Parasponia andersonii TaxID=3476 RepID=A0A2P5AYL7_PARAD|nr:hypothetical protein PanWU01x14_288010 [Parasponia andersonii]
MTEAKVVGVAFSWARNVGINLQFWESDALTVVKTLNNGIVSHSKFDDLLLDAFSLLSYFLRVLVKHVYRETNTTTHDLAKFASGSNLVGRISSSNRIYYCKGYDFFIIIDSFLLKKKTGRVFGFYFFLFFEFHYYKYIFNPIVFI